MAGAVALVSWAAAAGQRTGEGCRAARGGWGRWLEQLRQQDERSGRHSAPAILCRATLLGRMQERAAARYPTRVAAAPSTAVPPAPRSAGTGSRRSIFGCSAASSHRGVRKYRVQSDEGRVRWVM